MSEFEHTGVIVPRFWRDFRGKIAEVKLLATFLVTGRHNVGLPGCCEVSLVTVADELEFTLAQLDRLLDELPAGFASYDRKHRVLRVPNAPRIGHRPNHQVLRVWWRAWKALPESRLKYEHVESLREALPPEPSELVTRVWDETFGTVEIADGLMGESTGEAMGGATGHPTGDPIGGPTDPRPRPQSRLPLVLEKTTETSEGSSPRPRARSKSRVTPEPLPYTITALLAELRAGSDGLVVIEPYDSRLSPAITAVIREGQRQERPVTLADVRCTGEYMAANWRPGMFVGPEWVATTGKLLGAVGKARAWTAAGKSTALAFQAAKPLATRSGAVGMSPSDLAAEAQREMAEERRRGER